MALSNHERVGKALDLLKEGLRPFVERELKAHFGADWGAEVKETLGDTRLGGGKGEALQDVAVQLVTMDRHWGAVFRNTLGKAERSLVNELLEVRHRWAHQNLFSGDDADRALDSMARLLASVSAAEADEVGKMKLELRRLIYDEQVRSEKRRSAGTAIESAAHTGLKPWREPAHPIPRPTTWKWADSVDARPSTVCAMWLGESSHLGGQPALKKASRSCAAGSFNRWLIRRSSRTAMW